MNKLMRNILGTLLVAGVFASCSDDFLDVNTNPNVPSESTPDLTLAVAQDNWGSLNATSMTYLGQFFAYNWGTPSNWSANNDLTNYNVNSTFYSTIFNSSYGVIFRDLTYVMDYESEGADYSAYDAISLVIRSFQYQYLVDLYGDVPYTEANQRADNPTPAYDDAQEVYMNVLNDLTEAVTLIDGLAAGAANPQDQDIVFGGDMQMWAKLANTVKLRMLLRLSDGGFASTVNTEISNIQSNGYGFITEDVYIQPGYSDNPGKQSPFWGYIGFQPGSTAEVDRHDYTVATQYAIDNLTSTNDDRIGRIYEEASAGGYHGVIQSTALQQEGNTSDETSKVGEGLLRTPGQSQIIMTAAESYLIQAELAQKGFLGGNAQDLYETAIEKSYEFLGLPVADAQTYYSQPIENVSWAASTNKIAAIAYQKRVALNGSNSIELWIEHTRTGLPTDLPLAEGQSERPVSLLYPSEEIATNSENVPPQTAPDAFTNFPFWKQ